MQHRLFLVLGLLVCLLFLGCEITTGQHFRKNSASRIERERDIAECQEMVTFSHPRTKYEDFEKCMQDKGYSLEWEAFRYGLL